MFTLPIKNRFILWIGRRFITSSMCVTEPTISFTKMKFAGFVGERDSPKDKPTRCNWLFFTVTIFTNGFRKDAADICEDPRKFAPLSGNDFDNGK